MKISKYLGRSRIMSLLSGSVDTTQEVQFSEYTVKDLRSLLQNEPDNLQLKIRIILQCIEKELVDGCDDIIRELDPRYPKSVGVNSALGRWFLFVGNYEKARVKWSRVLERNPEIPDALVNLSYIDLAEKKYADALNKTDDILIHPVTPVRHKAYTIRAKVYQAMQEPEKELECWNDLLVAEPDSLQARLNLVRCMFKLNRLEVLLPILDESIINYPENSKFWATKCECLLKMGRVKQANDTLDKLGKLESEGFNNLYLKAVLFEKLDRIEEADSACAQALAIQPDDVPALVLHARLAQSQIVAA